MKKKYIKPITIALISGIFSIVNISAQINFTERLIDDNTHGMGSIYVTDLDGDLDQDVLAACLEDNQILWFRNDGGNPINWTKIIIASNVYSAHSVYAADFDKDEDLDVVGAAYYGSPGIAWWRNDGGNPVVWTKFTVAQNFVNAHEVYACDLDKDNDFDILGASSDLNTIAWWRNDGGNPVAWTEHVLSDNVTLAKSVHVGDFDGDNDLDVVGVSIIDNDIIWWRNEGGNPITWSEFLVDGNFGGAHRVQAVDMDQDGDEDILGAGYLGHQVAWWRNDGGNPISWAKQPIAYGIYNACVARAIDLDKDDDLDVVATAQGDNEILWWRNEGNGSTDWTEFVITDEFLRPWPLFTGDFDGDEDIDIVSGSSHNGSNEIKWWENDGVVGIDHSYKSHVDIIVIECKPNPFTSKATIEFEVKESFKISLKIFDIFGKEVKVIKNNEESSGIKTITWDGTDNYGQIVPAGVYNCNIQAGPTNQTIKIIKSNNQ